MKTFFYTKPFITLSTGVITLLFIQNLLAEPLPQRGPLPFYIYDIDSNGHISQDEFLTTRSQRIASRTAQGYPMRGPASEPNFTEFDTNKDGQLNPDELARGQQLQMQKRWDLMRQAQKMGMRQNQGRNMAMRQGQSRGAMCSGTNKPRFEDFDQNKDGLLTPDEFSQGQQQHMKKKWAMMRQSQGMGMRQGQGKGMGAGRNKPKFADFDANKDGFISEQELIKARSMRISNRIQQGYQMRNTANIPQFQEIDQNSDNKISPEEFSAHQKQHQMRR